jgi:hypothetical protein
MKTDDKAATTIKEILIGKNVSEDDKQFALTQALLWYRTLNGIWELVIPSAWSA